MYSSKLNIKIILLRMLILQNIVFRPTDFIMYLSSGMVIPTTYYSFVPVWNEACV